MSNTTAFAEKTYSKLTYLRDTHLPPEAIFMVPEDVSLVELASDIEAVLGEDDVEGRAFLQELKDGGMSVRILFPHEKIRAAGVRSNDYEVFENLRVSEILEHDGLVGDEISSTELAENKLSPDRLKARLDKINKTSAHDISDKQRRTLLAAQSNANRIALLKGNDKPTVVNNLPVEEVTEGKTGLVSFVRLPNITGSRIPSNGWFDFESVDLPNGLLSDPFSEYNVREGLSRVNSLVNYDYARSAFATLLGSAGMRQYDDQAKEPVSDIEDFITAFEAQREQAVAIKVDLTALDDVDMFDRALQQSIDQAADGLDDFGVELYVVYSEDGTHCDISVKNHLSGPANHAKEVLEVGLDEFNRVLSEKYGALVSPILTEKLDEQPRGFA